MAESNCIKVFFCTTCKNRTQHLRETLPENLANNKRATFLLLNYNSQDDLGEYLFSNHISDIDSGRLIVYRFTEPGPFRMAHSKNLAHRLAIREGADVLCNLDADNFAGAGFDEYLAEHFFGRARMYMWARMVKDGTMSRGIYGRIVAPKEAFLVAGGYDEQHFNDWSADDKDFNTRMRLLDYHGEEIDRRFLNALNHNDKMRFKEYPGASQNKKCYYDDPNYIPSHPIANDGNVGCGVVYRNFSREPIEITPMPTRVFGIGLHKTATTSLHGAFRILGYSSGHWTNAHWAKRIWKEMREDGRSPTLERNYSLCDLPIPLLYKDLDVAYPGSRFILTIRDEKDWLESVRNHWSHHNRFRAQWDNDPFTHKIHRELYGRKSFDAEVMLARYRWHNAEVLEYFRFRPEDLLVMNMSQSVGWHELCGFLRERIPDQHYPHHFASGSFNSDGDGI